MSLEIPPVAAGARIQEAVSVEVESPERFYERRRREQAEHTESLQFK